MKPTLDIRGVNSGLRAIENRMKLLQLQKMQVKAGILSKKNVRSEGKLSNALIASMHELGTSKFPARPFLGPPFRANIETYIVMLKKAYVVAFQKTDPGYFEKTLRRIGMKIVADTRAYVRAGIDPPNALSTIRSKGSSKPLVDTGELLRAIDYEVS